MNLGITNDNTKYLLLNNKPIEEKLHVVAVVSNPCNFKIRYKLTNEFIKRMEKEPNVILYVVELVYNNQEFEITSADNKRHLQVRGKIPLWHKENMINMGIKHLLPSDWKAVAWIDADVAFDSPHWATDALKLLDNGKDFIQLFTHCIDMDFDKKIMNTFTSFCYQYCNNFKKGTGENYWHPGFAWACNRATYDKLGGIFEAGILGSGDNITAHAFIKKAVESLKKGMSQGYRDFVQGFQDKVEGLKLGYVPGPIRHYFHGKKENRNYYGREDILIKYQYNPYSDIAYDDVGLILPSESFSRSFQKDILDYFKNRNEDEMVLEEVMTKTADDKDVLEHAFPMVPKFDFNSKNVSEDVARTLSSLLPSSTTRKPSTFPPAPAPAPTPTPTPTPKQAPAMQPTIANVEPVKRGPSIFNANDFAPPIVSSSIITRTPYSQPAFKQPTHIQPQALMQQQQQAFMQQHELIQQQQQAFIQQQALMQQQLLNQPGQPINNQGPIQKQTFFRRLNFG